MGTRLLLGMGLIAGLLVGAQGAAGAATSGCWSFHDYERNLSVATNTSRAGSALKALTLDPELSMAARIHSAEMARAGKPYHSNPEHVAKLVDGVWHMIGENVGVGGRVSSLHEMFLASPTHRYNIFKTRWDRIGVGEVFRDGRHWVTVLFEDGRDLDTTLRRRAC